MISHLELRHLIETAFLPRECICHISADNSMIVQLLNADTHKEELTVTGINAAKLITSQAIAAFVTELKEEVKARNIPIRVCRHS